MVVDVLVWIGQHNDRVFLVCNCGDDVLYVVLTTSMLWLQEVLDGACVNKQDICAVHIAL